MSRLSAIRTANLFSAAAVSSRFQIVIFNGGVGIATKDWLLQLYERPVREQAAASTPSSRMLSRMAGAVMSVKLCHVMQNGESVKGW